jgi:uncharacterized membrane protein
MNSRIKELINPLPAYKILHVSDRVDGLAHDLKTILDEVDGTLNLALYERSDAMEGVKVQYVSNYEEIFRALPRDHDIVIFYNTFSKHQKQESMIKNAYHTLANAAFLIIIEQKGIMDISLVKHRLENLEFRAPNEIDLLEGYDLIMAKKMHMWGNGL